MVQERPSLGSLQRSNTAGCRLARVDRLRGGVCGARGRPALDSGSAAWPVIPLAPSLLVGVSQVLGLYGSSDNVVNRMAGFHGRPVLLGRLVITALFAWTASWFIASHCSGLGAIGQLALWILAFTLGGVGAPCGRGSLARRIEHVEPCVVVGDARRRLHLPSSRREPPARFLPVRLSAHPRHHEDDGGEQQQKPLGNPGLDCRVPGLCSRQSRPGLPRGFCCCSPPASSW